MARTVTVEGLRELEKALSELPKSTGKNVLRRVLRKRAEPVASAANASAPDDPATPGKRIQVMVGTVLSKRQKGLHRKMFKDDRASVEMFVGATPGPAAVQQEFGNVNHGAQPFMRPSWDENGDGMLDGLAKDLGEEIDNAARRLARKAARLAAKG
jgi:HK97 gp10 family phage protein